MEGEERTMHSEFEGFDDVDLAVSVEEEAPETIPIVGSAHLRVDDVCEALFFSAEWSIVAKVGQHELGRSTPSSTPHSVAFIKRWARQLVRANKARLQRLGVDVARTYVDDWGGIAEDLVDYDY